MSVSVGGWVGVSMDMRAGTMAYGDGGKKATSWSQLSPSAMKVAEKGWGAQYFIEQTANTTPCLCDFGQFTPWA